jgi:general stress protein 26
MTNTSTNDGLARTVRGSLSELTQLLAEFDTAMLTTVTTQGRLHARPMAVQEPTPELSCDLWFVTASDSNKVFEIEREHQVGVSCYRARDRAYLSISGYAHLLQDRELAKRLFRPAWKLWFPQGADDPTIAIVELQVESADYWEPKGGRLRVVYELAKSLLRGEQATTNLPPPKHV